MAFIETSSFPVALVSEVSGKEKQGGGRPDYWEMAFWWTRKPLSSARAVIAGCLLPDSTDPKVFINSLRLNEKVPHRYNPSIPENWYSYFKGKRLLDPFSGYGSIPLEALRLGMNAIAVELLPVPNLYLKTVLEYPSKFGPRLIEDVEKWGNWISEQLHSDPLLKELYDEDVLAYVGSWEIVCPHCRKWTLLVGNWWLGKQSKKRVESGTSKKDYTRIAWMKPKPEHDKITIEIVDLNKQLGDALVANAKIEAKTSIAIGTKKYAVPKPNIYSNGEWAQCLHCGNPIRYIDPKTGSQYLDTKKLPSDVHERLQWYVKYAMRTTNSGNALARQRLLVKVKKDSQFVECTDTDQKKLEIALLQTKKMIDARDPDIPFEPIAPYATRYIHPLNYYASSWYQLFNPRQLLTMVRIVNQIREAAKRIEQEKRGLGLDENSARQYAEATATYLSLALTKTADYSTLVTHWHLSFLIVANSVAMRGIAMFWNWCDINPVSDTTGSWTRSVSSVKKGLEYLSKAVTGSAPLEQFLESSTIKNSNLPFGSAKVIFGDASLLNLGEKVHAIVTDPPYYHDVPYSELSDFYYVWLKRALSRPKADALVPSFAADSFFKRIGQKQIEIDTQWKEFGKREVLVKLGSSKDMEEGRKRFLELLRLSFQNCSSHLIENGILATYYAHTSPEAWEALLESGWKGAKFTVTNSFPVATESAERAIARGKLSLDTSIVVVWRNGAAGSANIEQLYSEMLSLARSRATDLLDQGYIGRDFYIGTMAIALSAITKYEKIYSAKGELSTLEALMDYVYPVTAKAIVLALGEKAREKAEIRSPEALFYVMSKVLFGKASTKRKRLDRNDITLLCIGTRAQSGKLLELKIIQQHSSSKRVDEDESEEEEVAGESFDLVEPQSTDRKTLENLLEELEIDQSGAEPLSSIQSLRLMQYWGQVFSKDIFSKKMEILKSSSSQSVEEAISMAKILRAVLPKVDPEWKLSENLVQVVSGGKLI